MRIKKPLIFISSLIFFLALSVALDRLAGLFIHQQAATTLIFPPNAKYHFQTPEFSYTVQTNSLGFRDRNFDLSKKEKFRILAIGDSFTYGWGVETDQSWPKVLESRLRTSGYDVEIANLGKPGGSPTDYADIAEKATPLLKPDLLIIGVLQSDDLAQLDPSHPLAEASGQSRKQTALRIVHRSAKAAASFLYPNFLALMKAHEKSQASLTTEWTQTAKTALAIMTPTARSRFERLDSEIKDAFMKGELNPYMIYLSVSRPDYYLQPLDLNSESIRPLIVAMAEQLSRIRRVAVQNNAKVIVVSVPQGVYVSGDNLKSRQRVGFLVNPEMLETNAPDEAINTASGLAGVAFHAFTGEFRRAASEKSLFFDLDGHFNPAGHQLFAEALTPTIERQIAGR
jgi:lysophospholipase L1-like esterase